MTLFGIRVFADDPGKMKSLKEVLTQYSSFPGGSMVMTLPANAGDAGSNPGSRRSPEKEMAIHSSTLAWEIPWTEEPGGLQSFGS